MKGYNKGFTSTPNHGTHFEHNGEPNRSPSARPGPIEAFRILTSKHTHTHTHTTKKKKDVQRLTEARASPLASAPVQICGPQRLPGDPTALRQPAGYGQLVDTRCSRQQTDINRGTVTWLGAYAPCWSKPTDAWLAHQATSLKEIAVSLAPYTEHSTKACRARE